MNLFFFVFQALSYNPNQLRRIEQLMAFRQFWNAYQELTNIISQEKGTVDNNVYRLRAQCCLNMAMVKECLDDTKKILKNSPSADDKRTAYTLQSRAYIQRGDFTSAEDAAKKAQDRQLIRNCQELQRLENNALDKAEHGQISEAAQLYDQLLRNCPKASHLILERANLAWYARDLGRYRDLTNDIEKEYPSDAILAYRRGIVSLCDGQMEPAMRNLKRALGIRDAPRNVSDALEAVRKVNEHFPIAQRHIESGEVEEGERRLEAVKKRAEIYCPRGTVLWNTINRYDLKLLRLKNTPEEMLAVLNSMLEESPDSLDLMLERGDLQLELGDYDAALFDFSNVQRRNPGNQRAQEGINRAQEMKKKANFVDHYAILGIDNGASEREIKDAYRKMVREWHPDRFGDKKKKAEAEAMMKKINTAYDVLGDPQKKRMYDAGQDPDDMSGGANMNFGFNPVEMFFGQGGAQFFQFGNGQQFHFEFHF